MCPMMVPLAESLAVVTISADKNGPKALVFMQAVAEDRQPKCSRAHFQEICHRLIQSAPFYTEYLAKLAQTLEGNESLSPLREILRAEISAQMPAMRERMYEAAQGAMKRFPNLHLSLEGEWKAYLNKCFEYPALGQLVGEVAIDVFDSVPEVEPVPGQLVGEVAIDVFGLPESREHNLRRGQRAIEDPQQEWRERVFRHAFAAMKTGGERAAPLPHDEGSSPVRDFSPAFT